MTMSTSEQPILEFDREDTEMTSARTAGWKRADLHWERLQEVGNQRFELGDIHGASQAWRRAWWVALFAMPASDPRWATTHANLGLLDRVAGRETRARKRYVKALKIWEGAHDYIDKMTIARRARSSLFHLRMEALHWETYQDNIKTRFKAFAAETAGALDAMASGQPAQCRLYSRWRGEKPSIFDDTRKFLSAALLVGNGAGARKRPDDQ